MRADILEKVAAFDREDALKKMKESEKLKRQQGKKVVPARSKRAATPTADDDDFEDCSLEDLKKNALKKLKK